MKRKRIGIDIDGTLAESINPWLKNYNQTYGRDVKREEIVDYSLVKRLNITQEESSAINAKVWDNYHSIEMSHPQAANIIGRLSEHAEVCIVTGSNAKTEQIIGWLELNKVSFDKVYHVSRQRNKVLSQVDVQVDDSAWVTHVFAKNMTKTILLDQPWNRNEPINEKMTTRAPDWIAVEEIANELLLRR